MTANVAIKYNMLYISVYQLIKEHIDAKTQVGKDLCRSQRTKEISLDTMAKDEFQEGMYSASQFDYKIVMEMIRQTIQEKRTN